MGANHLVPLLIALAAIVFAVLRRRRGGRAKEHVRAAPRSDAPARFGVLGLVAEREIRQRVRGRAFRIATVLILLGVAAAVIIPAAVKGKSHAEQVGVVGPLSAELRQSVTTAARAAGTDARIRTEPDTAGADRDLRSGRVDLVIIDGTRLRVKRAISSGDTGTTALLARTLAQLMGAQQAIRAAGLTGAQAAALSRTQPAEVTGLEPAPAANTAAHNTATFAVIILFVLLTQYLSWTLVGVMEEKSNRVVEVLLAAVRPLQLLSGKVIGIAAVVFAQAAVVAAFALALAGAVGSDLLHGAAPLVLLAALAWLLLGYGFYCWLYAAAGSTAERQDQVQALALPLSLPMIAGYILSITAAAASSPPTYLWVLGFLPPTAPFAMTMLVGLGAATWWQFVLSALISVACTLGIARLAATVYERAILRTGRRVPLREVLARVR